MTGTPPARANSSGRSCEEEEDIAPDDGALVVHDADPVRVAVEADTQVRAFPAHGGDHVLHVLVHGRVGVVRGEGAVDLRVEQDMRAGQAGAQHPHRLPGRAVAGIPGNFQRPLAVEVFDDPLDIGIEHRPVLARPSSGGERTIADDAAEPPDLLAVERTGCGHKLETVMVGRVVRARHHDPRIGIEPMHREIEHRRRAEPDPDDPRAGARQPVDQGGFELRGMQPAIVADTDDFAAARADDGAEGAADRLGIGLRKGLSDDSADVVGAEDRRVERPCRAAPPGPHPAPSIARRPTLR